MSGESFDSDAELADFSGRVRLFPLPEVAIFPNVVQPLHVFEPRYRDLLQATLDSDQLIAMAVLQGGWEGAEEPAPLERPVCIGRVVSHTPLPDGRSNILLLGLRRARIIRELPQRELYRQADVELCEDIYSAEGAANRGSLLKLLASRFKRMLPQVSSGAQGELEKLVSGVTSLGLLTDVVAAAIPISAKLQLDLLGELNVDSRAELLIESMDPPPLSPYHWEFSNN